jgi:hypothetical protein
MLWFYSVQRVGHVWRADGRVCRHDGAAANVDTTVQRAHTLAASEMASECIKIYQCIVWEGL